jgi:putative addiction module component (TIGR02574 family)
MDAKRVIDEALRLPPDARAALAGQLLASLNDSEVDPDREGAWANEIRARLDAWERGELTSISEDDFLAGLARAARGKPAT